MLADSSNVNYILQDATFEINLKRYIRLLSCILFQVRGGGLFRGGGGDEK